MSKRLFVSAALALVFSGAAPGRAQERGARPDLPADAALRSQVIGAVVRNMKEHYVFPEVAERIERDVRERRRRGEYGRVTCAAELAKVLTAQLREVSRDKHVSVNYSREPLPPREGRAEPLRKAIETVQGELEELKKSVSR